MLTWFLLCYSLTAHFKYVTVSRGNRSRPENKERLGFDWVCNADCLHCCFLSLLSALSTICLLSPFTLTAYRETDGVLVITPAVWSVLSAIVHGTMANQGLQKGGKTCMKEGKGEGRGNSDHPIVKMWIMLRWNKAFISPGWLAEDLPKHLTDILQTSCLHLYSKQILTVF